MGDDSERLSLLISDIYDAALDPLLWPRVLQKACGFVRGSSANLFYHDPASSTGALYFQWGNDPYYEQLYFEKYIKMNPLFPGLTMFEVGEVYSQSDIISYSEFYDTRFYKEWVRPQGQVDVLGTVIEKSATSLAMLAIRRHERDGRVDADSRRRLGLIAPHVRRAVLIGRVIDFNKTTVATLTDTLGGLAAGVFLVDANLRIVFANSRGQAMLSDGEILRSVDSTLAAIDPAAEKALRDVLVATGSGDRAIGDRGIAVRLPAGEGEAWLAHVLPLTSGARHHAGITYSATAAVFVRKASLHAPPALETVARLYKLTTSEVRVLAALLEIGGGSAVAEALGISEETVKTHLRHLFAKTGAARQADLVKLVATHASPFAAE